MSPEELSSQILKMSDTLTDLNVHVGVLTAQLTEREKLADARRESTKETLDTHSATMEYHTKAIKELTSSVDETKGAIKFCQGCIGLLTLVMALISYWRK
jgi:hypothetical protein